MNSLDLLKAFSFIEDDLVFDAGNDGAKTPDTSAGIAPVKQPKHNKPQRGGAKAKAIAIGAVAAVLAAAIICLVLYLTGVFGGKQEPIYTGMEISAVDNTSSINSTSAVSHKYSGDYYGWTDGIDKNNPFGEDNSTLEQQTQSTLQVAGAGESIYYADAGDDIYITIKFSNPDSYEILSFIINDVKYSSYMFETGSDLENIIIKVNVGTVGGIIEYTISEIKYVDGTEIKGVTMEGDPVVKCGVRESGMTYAEISDEKADINSISFTVEIVDKYSLIAYSDGYVKAVLYDGENIIRSSDLQVGTNSVVFSDLSQNTVYQYAVVAMYDDFSGSGVALNYLYTNTVYTPAIVLFDDVEITNNGIKFGYSWYTGYSGSITSLTLTGGGTTKTLSASAASAAGLNSYTNYTLTAGYTAANGYSGTISLEFTTLPKVEVNSVELRNSSIAVSKNGTIVLQLSVNNPDGVTFDSVMVNGSEYAVSSVSTDTTLYVNIAVGDEFDGGLTTLNVSAVNCSIDDNTYTFAVDADAITVFINGELAVESFFVVRLENGKYEETVYASDGETLYYAIALDNSTEYDITSVTIDGEVYDEDNASFTVSDDKQTVYVSFTVSGEGYISAKLSSLSYKNKYMNSASTKSPNLSATYFSLTSSEVVEISTAEDLKNMTSTEYKYYKLMNNIALTESWVNISNCMYGVFDGNGYTISGLGAVESYEDTTLYLGLFSDADGCVINLTMTDIYYNINLSSTEKISDSVYVGAIAAKGDLTVSDCNITATIQLNISSKYTYVGGLVGYGSLTIGGSTVTATIAVSQTNNAELGTISGGNSDRCYVYIGGMVGSGSANVTDTTLKTNITGELDCKAAGQIGFSVVNWFDYGYVGGISGSGTVNIYNSTITATIKSTANTMVYAYLTSSTVGEISGSTITADCTFVDNAIREDDGTAYYSTIFSYTSNKADITESTLSYTENGTQYTYVYDGNGNIS